MPNLEIVADLDEIGADSPEWHRLRLSGIGGSDAGVVAGVSTWRSPYDLWSEKVRGELPDPSDEKEYQTWGKLLEDPIAEEFGRRTGIEVHPFRRMVRNPEYPFAFANVDRLTGPATALEGVLEVKTTRFADQWEEVDGVVQVPLAYAVQGMHYLAVLGLPRVHFACLVGGQQLRIAEVERNDTLIADLMALEADFWSRVTSHDPPAPDGSESTRKALQKRWRPDPDSVVELSPHFADLLVHREVAKQRVAEFQVALDGVDAEIMAALGEHEVGTIGGQKVVTWKGSTRTTIDTKALKEAHPALATEFAKTTQVRSLRYTATKEDA